MPIVDIDKSKQLEFGHGDIEVAAGLIQCEEVIGAVNFWENDIPQPIGAYHKYKENKVLSIEETPVRMVFTKIESIDVVMDQLQKAKEMMINKSIK